jgi:hypothetical protein
VKVRTILASFSATVLLVGCATMNTARLHDPTMRQILEPIKLQPSYESSFIREDLVRATHTVTTTSYVNGMMRTSSHEEPNDYSELVIDFGNGILMDYNNNLCIDLLRFYGLTKLSSYRIIRTPKGFSFESINNYDLKDGIYSSNVGMYRKVIQNDNGAQIESGLLHFKRIISVADRSVELSENILGIDVKKSATLTDDMTLQVKGFWKDSTFKIESPDQLVMEGYFKIMHEGDHLNIVYTGIFGITTERTFFRTENGFIFYDNQDRGVEVLRDGNTIRIERNGQIAAVYSIETD